LQIFRINPMSMNLYFDDHHYLTMRPITGQLPIILNSPFIRRRVEVAACVSFGKLAQWSGYFFNGWHAISRFYAASLENNQFGDAG
jgi:hypothetical protein